MIQPDASRPSRPHGSEGAPPPPGRERERMRVPTVLSGLAVVVSAGLLALLNHGSWAFIGDAAPSSRRYWSVGDLGADYGFFPFHLYTLLVLAVGVLALCFFGFARAEQRGAVAVFMLVVALMAVMAEWAVNLRIIERGFEIGQSGVVSTVLVMVPPLAACLTWLSSRSPAGPRPAS